MDPSSFPLARLSASDLVASRGRLLPSDDTCVNCRCKTEATLS